MSKGQSVFLNKTKNAIDNFSMLKKGEKILVGFSGGKDSVALLCALKELSPQYETELFAFHVHHGIRGEEADRDLEFCRRFCVEKGISFDFARVDAPLYAKENGIGLEEAARVLRYKAFDCYAEKNGITKIATAHTASDNFETVIFNLTRGSSAEGLKGIPPVREGVIRPLIYCTTDEVYAFVKEKGLSYVFDGTNDDTQYTRNYIRKKIVPLLKEINPECESAITRTCHTLRRDLDYITNSLGECRDYEETQELLSLHDAILSRKLVLMYENASKKTGALSFDHIESMISLLKDEKREGVKYISLPDRINFVVTKDRAYFERTEKTERNKKPTYDRKLDYGLNEFDEYGFDIFVSDGEKRFDEQTYKNVYKIAIHTAVKKDRITDTISVRCRKNGDSYRYGNMTRKVKKIMNEKGLEVSKRDYIPLFCDGKGIFWIPFFPLRDGMKPKNDDDGLLHLYYLEKK